jgi:hypothetical protein
MLSIFNFNKSAFFVVELPPNRQVRPVVGEQARPGSEE